MIRKYWLDFEVYKNLGVLSLGKTFQVYEILNY